MDPIASSTSAHHEVRETTPPIRIGEKWLTRRLSQQEALSHMIKNMHKAAIVGCAEMEDLYVSGAKITALLNDVRLGRTGYHDRSLTCHFYENQGKRRSMEDAHFVKPLSSGLLTGIFDGHGGDKVAKYAAFRFPGLFEKTLKELEGHVHKAFETTIHQIHLEVERLDRRKSSGTTAVVCFLEKNSSLVYTATVGDAEAFIYLPEEGEQRLKPAPLSPIIHWKTPKEQERAKLCGAIFSESLEPKQCRYPPFPFGINVSRAIGDWDITKYSHNGECVGALSHKPKITVFPYEKGNKIVLSCDGLRDFAPDEEVLTQIVNAGGHIAEKLAQVSLSHQTYHHGDNVTVGVIAID